MGPGSKPSWHEHSNPPTTLVQVPFPHGFPMEHSSVSEEEPTSSSNTLRRSTALSCLYLCFHFINNPSELVHMLISFSVVNGIFWLWKPIF